ncbi:hypothetical protein ISR94_02035 [Candidatus Microgenomates bacterium]|nr:hypothetical protein [Candidatus Microgenomates bacterium]
MNYITTTQLRTQTPDLLEALAYGQHIDLIHRSKPVATISPIKIEKPKLFSAKRMFAITKAMNLPKLTVSQRNKNYKEAMLKKHG